MTNSSDPDGVSTLYQYNAKGEQEYAAIDMDRNDSLDLDGTDRITRTVTDVTTDGGVNVRRTRTYGWFANGSSTSTLLSTMETSVDGLRSWQIQYRDVSTPVTNQTITVFSAGGYRYVTNIAPDGSYAVSAYLNGRLVSATKKNSSAVQLSSVGYTYDAHGRMQSSTDARNGATTYSYNNADQVLSVTTPAPGVGGTAEITTTYYNNSLQATNVVNPDGTSVITEYLPTGELLETHGSRTYPVTYTYDYAGRMKTMKTWQDFAGNSGSATTTWSYDGNRGFLTNKTYDGGVQGPSYSYTSAGRLQSRLWARGITTYYNYDNAGGLTNIAYSDGVTSSVTNTYDRAGRPIQVGAGNLVTQYTYNLADELLVETNTAGVLAGLAIMNGYDSYLRRSDLTALGSTVLSHTTYSYTNDSRLWTVSDGTNNATYGYIVNSPLVSQIVFKSNSVTRMTTSKQYDYLNRLTQISNAPSASPAVAFNYSYNNANERTRNSAIDGSYWVYQYDSLGQVTSGKKYWADGTSVAGQQFGYNFDDIGNRKSTQTGGNEAGVNLRIARYTNNSLNQITSRDVPGYVNVMGIALATNSVTVNGQPTYRKGEYFRYELEVANTNLAVWTNITVASPGQTSVTGNKFLPKTAEGFYYDADGNLTNDGRWVYTWDGENRLVAMVVNTNVGPQYQLRFAYDAKGLRIQKYVSLNGISIYTNMFLYDGGNLVDELDPANGIVRSYVWGIDISGSLQHAGGVGGLLALSYGSGTTTNSFVAVDGNGNVVALENANDGTSLANFEYGPFGEVIRATGITAKTSPIRFSSKYQDDESGLLYFGYRFYNEFDGKWISRDPLTERGGLNLYAFVSNDPIDKGDIFGLQDYKVVGKSFINGFGPRGRLGMRWGLNIPGLPFSEFPWFADTRLGIFERLVTGLPAFNQNPTDDSKDGSYRLFARTIVHVNCDGGHLSSATIDALDSQGGEEFPGIFGTINATANFYTGSSGATLKLRTWGHPNDLVEPGMQWVALRTSRNIWHEAVIKFRCGCEPQVDSFTGSRYPSRKLWINGNLQKDIRQKSISSLWDADFADPSFVAP